MGKLLAIFCICGFFSIQASCVGVNGANNPSPGRVNQAQGGSNPSAGQSPREVNDALSSMDSAFAEMYAQPTTEDLYYLGLAVAANILASYKPYTGNPELTHYLNLICQAIMVHSPEIELFDGAHVLILDSPELNAFSSPGGHILITRGFVEALDSEDKLAAVIAHELAHIILKHGASIIADMRFNDEMTAIANRAFDFSGRNSPDARRLMELRESVTMMVDTLFRNGYSQHQEFAADQEALILLALAGYNPRALIGVLELLQRTQRNVSSAMNTTHPVPSERIANAERLLRGRQFRETSLFRAHRFINR